MNASDFGLGNLGSAEALSGGAALQNFDPKTAANREEIEIQWAVKAYQHAETYFSLITAVDASLLKLTKSDDEIYKEFREKFKDFKVDVIDIEEMKSPEAKQKWRPFCEMFKEKVEDYNFGTMLRMDSSKDYSEENTELVVRVQFLAIEIARNREGHNSNIKIKKDTEKETNS